jgi:hypothetical protein
MRLVLGLRACPAPSRLSACSTEPPAYLAPSLRTDRSGRQGCRSGGGQREAIRRLAPTDVVGEPGLVPGGPAWAEDRACRGTIGDVTVHNLRVPDDETCILDGTLVEGTVKVESDAVLKAYGIRVQNTDHPQRSDRRQPTVQGELAGAGRRQRRPREQGRPVRGLSRARRSEVSVEEPYFAYSTERVSRTTVILIWPGYCSSSSTCLAMSRAMTCADRSSMSSGLTITRTSRPACIA